MFLLRRYTQNWFGKNYLRFVGNDSRFTIHFCTSNLMTEAGAEVRVASCGLGLFRALLAYYMLYAVIRTRIEFKQHKRRKKWRVFLHSLNFVPVFCYRLLHISDVG